MRKRSFRSKEGVIKKFLLVLFISLILPNSAWGGFISKTVPYSIDGTGFEGKIIYHKNVAHPTPGILMVPSWMGPTQQSLEKAASVAGDRYVVFMIDMYGRDIRPKNASEAGAVAGRGCVETGP